MMQEILTLLIFLAAVAYVVYALVKIFRKKDKQKPCDSCYCDTHTKQHLE